MLGALTHNLTTNSQMTFNSTRPHAHTDMHAHVGASNATCRNTRTRTQAHTLAHTKYAHALYPILRHTLWHLNTPEHILQHTHTFPRARANTYAHTHTQTHTNTHNIHLNFGKVVTVTGLPDSIDLIPL